VRELLLIIHSSLSKPKVDNSPCGDKDVKHSNALHRRMAMMW